jgi:hypothetical protein
LGEIVKANDVRTRNQVLGAGGGAGASVAGAGTLGDP